MILVLTFLCKSLPEWAARFKLVKLQEMNGCNGLRFSFPVIQISQFTILETLG
jgi:hypothetical protein